jgi:hypothetical protein
LIEHLADVATRNRLVEPCDRSADIGLAVAIEREVRSVRIVGGTGRCVRARRDSNRASCRGRRLRW